MSAATPTSSTYLYRVSPTVDTPVPPGVYGIHIIEGGQYRNVASARVYSVREVTPGDPDTIRYEYTGGRDAEHVSREGNANELAVVEAVGSTPAAIVGYRRPR